MGVAVVRITGMTRQFHPKLFGDAEMQKHHKRWLNRAETEPDKLERVLADVRSRCIEGVEFKKNPAAYAEDLWKRFQ